MSRTVIDKCGRVRKWRKTALQAYSMSVGLCTETSEVMVGIDMNAEDQNTFAHGHFDLETAVEFASQLNEAIEEAMAKKGGIVH